MVGPVCQSGLWVWRTLLQKKFSLSFLFFFKIPPYIITRRSWPEAAWEQLRAADLIRQITKYNEPNSKALIYCGNLAFVLINTYKSFSHSLETPYAKPKPKVNKNVILQPAKRAKRQIKSGTYVKFWNFNIHFQVSARKNQTIWNVFKNLKR